MITRKNLPFQNVVDNGVASMSHELGMTVQRTVLELGNTAGAFTKSMIERILCKIDGKPFYETTGDDLDAMNKYKGVFDDATHLSIDFGEMFAQTPGGALLGGIPTAQGVGALTFEIKITGATNPTLESVSQLSAPRPFSPIMALATHPVSLSAGGKHPILMPYSKDAHPLIKRIYIFHANVTELTVKKNGVEVHEEVSTSMNDFIAKEFNRVPQAGLYVYDPIVSGNTKEHLVTVNARTLQVIPNLSGADNLRVYVEMLADLSKL